MGSSKAPTLQYSARDLASQTRIKLRRPGQHALEEMASINLREQLLRVEAEKAQRSVGSNEVHTSASVDTTVITAAAAAVMGDENTPAEIIETLAVEKPMEAATINVDCTEEDSDDEDMEALLAELEKIKREREAEKEREQQAERRNKLSNATSSNPLLKTPAAVDAGRDGFKMKRRWDQDVIFKEQRSGGEGKTQKRFINDTIRSDFHRKFMDRYIK